MIGKPNSVYHDLNHADAAALTQHANTIIKTIESTRRTLTEAIIEIGSQLSQAQAILAGKGREGLFRPWFTNCCGLPKTTVYRAIAAYEAFNKCPTVGHFDAKAIYLLSSDACPEAATQEAIQLAEDGEHIDYCRAKEIVAKYAGGSNDDDGHDGDHEDLGEGLTALPKPRGGNGETADKNVADNGTNVLHQDGSGGDDRAVAAAGDSGSQSLPTAPGVTEGAESLRECDAGHNGDNDTTGEKPHGEGKNDEKQVAESDGVTVETVKEVVAHIDEFVAAPP